MSDFVEVNGLCKSYLSGDEQLNILVNLALNIRKGRMVAITGASGSGKSTLLHLLGGMETVDSGTIVIAGQEITRLERTELARFRNTHIGFVFQFHHLLPEFSAIENVMFPLLLRGASRSKASRHARELLAEVGLEERLHHRPGALSGGEQQRVAIARALAGRPLLLLADEPTGNLDVHTSENVYRLLIDMHVRRDLTSVIVTHNPRLALLCDEEFRMADGALTPGDAVDSF